MMSEFEQNGLNQPTDRPFPWFCARCRKETVRPEEVSYHTERLYDGCLVPVDLPHLRVPRCENCGELVFASIAEQQIFKVLEARARQPSPPLANAGPVSPVENNDLDWSL